MCLPFPELAAATLEVRLRGVWPAAAAADQAEGPEWAAEPAAGGLWVGAIRVDRDVGQRLWFKVSLGWWPCSLAHALHRAGKFILRGLSCQPARRCRRRALHRWPYRPPSR